METDSVSCQLFWILLAFRVWLSDCRHTRVSLDDDLLSPYVRGHGPAHSHRHIRDCQLVAHGNVTYEARAPSNPSGLMEPETSVLVTDVPDSPQWAYGHMTVVPAPLRMLSVLEPGGPGGCGAMARASVEVTAAVAADCLVAQNAGFFHMQSGRCLGNIVSDGQLVQNSGGVQNAQFGIRRDGTLVFGYLSEEDVLDQTNPFLQLVSGVVWLLRNGQVYINQSLEAECSSTQETGNFRHFVDVISARTAVGHDSEGRLVLFHIDGQTDRRGMSLWDVANYLKRNGVVNAINLDGGGSATYVTNGSLASYPSDHCVSDAKWRCARAVSTVLCVHPERCRPRDCSGHGDCVGGRCRCHAGYHGDGCSSLPCQPAGCGGRGICTAGGCVCEAGWTGHNCSQECLQGFYGDSCNLTCACINGGSCDPVHGRCTCPPGFHGDSCQQECDLGFYGLACQKECVCEDQCPCNPQTGSCSSALRGERNATMYRAGQCLARQMMTIWMRQEKPYMAELTWLALTVTLASLLLASLLGHLTQARRGGGGGGSDYAYVPLSDMGRGASLSNGGEMAGRGPEDSDSQEDLWSMPRPHGGQGSGGGAQGRH